jgi:ribosomal protein S18 acetylase RimI-like enzyme
MAETGPPLPGAAGSSLPIRAALTSEAADAARLHAEGIDQGFLSLLGPRFLGRLYRRITLDRGSFLIVATRDDRVVGFVAGSVDVPSLYRSFLWRDGLAAGLPALGHLLTHWHRVLETLRHGSSEGAGTGPGAELLAIAVDRSARGAGAGHSLVDAFVDELARRRVAAAHVVVGADNRAAVGLYRRSGFEEVERFELHPGTESLLMVWHRSAEPVPVEPPGPTAP